MQDNKLIELQEKFKKDRFATQCGCTIIEASAEKVVCEMPITDLVRNAYGGVMGGSIFTLSDFALAVTSNYAGIPTVAVECSIRFYSATKGKKLIATCIPDKDGRTLGHYTVEVVDDLGKKVAGFTAVAFHQN